MISLTKAYIVEKNESKYKIRIPLYHGVNGSANYVADADLPYASVCTLSGASDIYLAGDVVFVYFEDNNQSKPVILGSLLLSEAEKKQLVLSLDQLKVDTKVTLPSSTTIGKVTASEIGYLTNLSDNIQTQFNNILNSVSTYRANYNEGEFASTNTWVLEDKGYILESKLLDDFDEPLDTLDYIHSASASASPTYGPWNDTDGVSSLIESDGYLTDRRFRLNWLGSQSVFNDKVKIQSGLYARNYWTLTKGASVGSNRYLAQPEYTWRPTIQGSTSSASLKLAESTNDPNNSKLANTGYYPYYLMLNPDGGDTMIGRQGYVTVRDRDVAAAGGTVKDQALIIDTVALTVQDGKLRANGQPIGSGSGSGSVFFTYDVDIQASSNFGHVYSNPYLPYLFVRDMDRSGMYEQYVTEGNEINLLSGIINVQSSIVLEYTMSSSPGNPTSFGRFPVTGFKAIQLSSLMDLSQKIAYSVGTGSTITTNPTTGVFKLIYSGSNYRYYKIRYAKGSAKELVELESDGETETTNVYPLTNIFYLTNPASSTNKIVINRDATGAPTSVSATVNGFTNTIPVIDGAFTFPNSSSATDKPVIYDIRGDYIYSRETAVTTTSYYVIPEMYTATSTASFTVSGTASVATVTITAVDVTLNLNDKIGVNYMNIDYSFIVKLTPVFNKDDDRISILARNTDNYITVTDLSNANVIGFYKQKILSKVTDSAGNLLTNPDIGLDSMDPNYSYSTQQGCWLAPASINLCIYYNGVDAENLNLSEAIVQEGPTDSI